MKKRTTVIILLCFLGSVSVIASLAALSHTITHSKGSFLRSFRSHTANELSAIDLKVNSYYFAGVTTSNIYLGNYTTPLNILIVDLSSGDTSHIRMKINGIYEQKFWSVRTEIDSPYFHVHDGAVPRIYQGKINDWTATRFRYDTEYFTDLEPISKNRLAIRALMAEDNQNELGMISTDEPHFSFNPEVISRQVDGFFCTDGYLRYEKTLHKLVYLYRYRNEFTVMDTLLTPLYKSNTIDTNSVAKIEVASIQSSKTTVFKTPPLVVNDGCCVAGNYIYVKSLLTARNEPEDSREGSSNIDVYDLSDGQYVLSFRIYDYPGEGGVREFRVAKNKLFVLFQNHLQIFELNKRDFKKPLI